MLIIEKCHLLTYDRTIKGKLWTCLAVEFEGLWLTEEWLDLHLILQAESSQAARKRLENKLGVDTAAQSGGQFESWRYSTEVFYSGSIKNNDTGEAGTESQFESAASSKWKLHVEPSYFRILKYELRIQFHQTRGFICPVCRIFWGGDEAGLRW